MTLRVEKQSKILNQLKLYMTFEQNIRKWATLDSRISDINTTTRLLRNEKSELEHSIIRHVEDNSLNTAIVKLNDSKLHFVNTKVMPPLTYKFLKTCLTDIIENPEEVDDIISYIREKREPKITLGIKRYFNN